MPPRKKSKVKKIKSYKNSKGDMIYEIPITPPTPSENYWKVKM